MKLDAETTIGVAIWAGLSQFDGQSITAGNAVALTNAIMKSLFADGTCWAVVEYIEQQETV